MTHNTVLLKLEPNEEREKKINAKKKQKQNNWQMKHFWRKKTNAYMKTEWVRDWKLIAATVRLLHWQNKKNLTSNWLQKDILKKKTTEKN